MATYSTVLNLKLNEASDPFLLSDFIGNWTILDGSPGVYICTSASRPSWGTAQNGRLIFMTDYRCLSYWTGAEWTDLRDAVGTYAAGVSLGTSVAPNASVSYTIMTITVPRACSLVLTVTGTYTVPGDASQEGAQRVVFDGAGTPGGQLGGFRELMNWTARSGDTSAAGCSPTSLQIISGVQPGVHTVGVGLDAGGITNTPITIVGAKAVAMMAVYSSTNAL